MLVLSARREGEKRGGEGLKYIDRSLSDKTRMSHLRRRKEKKKGSRPPARSSASGAKTSDHAWERREEGAGYAHPGSNLRHQPIGNLLRDITTWGGEKKERGKASRRALRARRRKSAIKKADATISLAPKRGREGRATSSTQIGRQNGTLRYLHKKEGGGEAFPQLWEQC